MMMTLLLALGIFALFFVGVGIRLILIKDGEFRGTCASKNPLLQEQGAVCNVCGNDPAKCENKQLAELPAIQR